MGERWHQISIRTDTGPFTVVCNPHGVISTHETWFNAVIGQYAHDHEFKGPQSTWETS
jgi:hypothetical protein